MVQSQNAFEMYGPAGVSNPERAKKSVFASVVSETHWDSSSFPGLDASKPHLQATTGANYSSLLVSGTPGESIVLMEVLATSNDAITAGVSFMGTISEEGSDNDLMRFSVNGGGPVRWSGPIKLEEGKGLVYNRVLANYGLPTSKAFSLTVSYIKIPE